MIQTVRFPLKTTKGALKVFQNRLLSISEPELVVRMENCHLYPVIDSSDCDLLQYKNSQGIYNIVSMGLQVYHRQIWSIFSLEYSKSAMPLPTTTEFVNQSTQLTDFGEY